MLQKYLFICIFAILNDVLYALDYEPDETTTKSLELAVNVKDESLSPNIRVKSETKQTRNINCDLFSDYALNCTMNAALMYNSYKKSPPMPNTIHDWCKAIKYLTNCALEWNLDCRDVTDSHFNEESINGHSYVVHNICDDSKFIEQYSQMAVCVEMMTEEWESCYTSFKGLVDAYKKNTSTEWTHYETHFYLCCGRARFRRCVLDRLYKRSDVCNRNQAITLQKFSVIVSEGDVYQDCDFNVVYANCPGGDPRPMPGDQALSYLAALAPEFQQQVKLHSKGYAMKYNVYSGIINLLALWFTIVLCNIFL